MFAPATIQLGANSMACTVVARKSSPYSCIREPGSRSLRAAVSRWCVRAAPLTLARICEIWWSSPREFATLSRPKLPSHLPENRTGRASPRIRGGCRYGCGLLLMLTATALATALATACGCVASSPPIFDVGDNAVPGTLRKQGSVAIDIDRASADPE